MSEENKDSGEGFILFLLWTLFGWFPGFFYLTTIIGVDGVSPYTVNHPISITAMIIGYIVFPIFLFLLMIVVGLFINFCNWLVNKFL